MTSIMRIRSSIACARCRRSKIRCDNTGSLDSPCRNCVKSGNSCTWPTLAGQPSKSPELPSARRRRSSQEATTRSLRKRLKRNDAGTGTDDSPHSTDILVVRRIDRALWDKIFLTYQRHYATELPFLHIPTLKSKIYDLSPDRNPVVFDVNLVLLGLLALTGRYHPELVDYLEQAQGNGSTDTAVTTNITETTFARLMEKALGSFVTATSRGSVERVQALLMLGLYEWASPNHEGLRAWMLIGAAVRMAQALKLGREMKPHWPGHNSGPSSEELAVDREVRRRTMFSCFVFDRLMSCGKERPSIIMSEDIHVQLPCAKEDFDLSREVCTGFLSSELSGSALQPDLSILGHFLRLVDVWGRISHYTNYGGRFQDNTTPPWSSQSRFFDLRRHLDTFDQLVETPGLFLSLSPSNYFRHDSASSTYILFHLLMALCKIMLHRQYLPFIPIKCSKPSGPLDEPTFPTNEVPPGFWEQSAQELFRAGKAVVDLIGLCEDQMPHSPLAAFVIYTASFTAIYARYFPHMDTERSLAKEGAENEILDAEPASSNTGATKTLFDSLSKLAEYSGVASAFIGRFTEVDQYFSAMVRDYHHNLRHGSASQHSGSARLSVRMGGDTGGLEEWVMKSDRMVSNSTIIKEADHSDDSTQIFQPAAQDPELLGARQSGTRNYPTTRSRFHAESQASSLATHPPFEPELSIMPTSFTTVDESIAGGNEQGQSPFLPIEFPHFAGESMFQEDGDDWSWAFLHDMYLGSVSFDPADAGPGYSM
ncbi:hypothetical protein CMUS01_11619 [Colletotrichum musicola]|uniref:Zn(2)-C6 fungal-type domain-containing protein n=1 Tax=Colletotrichum musicola TaxID=2175873 RepID=A0A8H6N562_9PEZI|nr:hypothetical protein CMUS01_11619 [Colletotrichum musicola]